MCRMMAVIGDIEIQRKALHAFHSIGAAGRVKPWESPGHLDGWGIVSYGSQGPEPVALSSGDVEVEKEAYRKAVDESLPTNNRMVMTHFRKATFGDIRVENVHPFIDNRWVFAHNGSVVGMDALGPKPQQRGSTDSEEFLLRWTGQGKDIHGYRGWVEQVAKVTKFTSLSSLICDGKILCAMRKIGTCHTEFIPEEHSNLDLVPYYTLFYVKVGNAHIVSSEPLTDIADIWRPLHDGESLLLNL